ncbi:transcription initiation factor tfiid subunit 9 adenylate partial [Nannochloropsis oceanica]
MATPRQTTPLLRAGLKRPNILITGTPGTGKTTTARSIAEATGLSHLNVGDLVKEAKCYEGKDEELDTYILDEDKLLDCMEVLLADGGHVVDYHSCELFPERWFDLVLVVRADNATLFDRLSARGYSARKRNENLECEIMQVVLEEARESYDEPLVHEITSQNEDDLRGNVERVMVWVEQWKADCDARVKELSEMEE